MRHMCAYICRNDSARHRNTMERRTVGKKSRMHHIIRPKHRRIFRVGVDSSHIADIIRMCRGAWRRVRDGARGNVERISVTGGKARLTNGDIVRPDCRCRGRGQGWKCCDRRVWCCRRARRRRCGDMGVRHSICVKSAHANNSHHKNRHGDRPPGVTFTPRRCVDVVCHTCSHP